MTNLPKVVTRRAKRVGRGVGSGKGFHTSGRGQKGQKARTSVGILFEGFKVKKSLLRRLPMQRGKDKFKASGKPIAVSIDVLNDLSGEITIDSLIKAGVVKESEAMRFGVKILDGGEITKKLTIALPISKAASRKVVDAGGKIV